MCLMTSWRIRSRSRSYARTTRRWRRKHQRCSSSFRCTWVTDHCRPSSLDWHRSASPLTWSAAAGQTVHCVMRSIYSCVDRPLATPSCQSFHSLSDWKASLCVIFWPTRSSNLSTHCHSWIEMATVCRFEGDTMAAAPLPFRLGDPALCGSCPLVASQY